MKRTCFWLQLLPWLNGKCSLSALRISNSFRIRYRSWRFQIWILWAFEFFCKDFFASSSRYIVTNYFFIESSKKCRDFYISRYAQMKPAFDVDAGFSEVYKSYFTVKACWTCKRKSCSTQLWYWIRMAANYNRVAISALFYFIENNCSLDAGLWKKNSTPKKRQTVLKDTV